MTFLLFSLIVFGVINMSKIIVNTMLILLLLPIMINYYLSNPGEFHNSYGFSKDLAENLPIITATEAHLSDCIICCDKIIPGSEIIVLRCQGRHFYHSSCIVNWLITKFNCPLCKSFNIL